MSHALVVDDDPLIVQLLSVVLEGGGFEVESAPSGEEALELIGRRTPDIVLLDVMMPGIDGLEVTRRLRRDPRTRSLPVVLVSACASQADADAGRAAGATEYVSKPFDPHRLRTLVTRLAAGG